MAEPQWAFLTKASSEHKILRTAEILHLSSSNLGISCCSFPFSKFQGTMLGFDDCTDTAQKLRAIASLYLLLPIVYCLKCFAVRSSF